MKRAFSTVACMTLSYQEVLDAAVRNGIEGVEVRLDESGRCFGLQTQAQLMRAAAEFQQAGVAITNLGTSICLNGMSDGTAEQVREAAKLARCVGAPAIRVFLGNFPINHRLPTAPVDSDALVLALREICNAAAEQQVQVWVETHNEYATGRALAGILAKTQRENLRLIWDVMHTIEQGEPPQETWRQIGEQIAHIHLKDGFNRCDTAGKEFQYCALGEGAVPLTAVLAMLRQEGYAGFVSLEWEIPWRTELQVYPAKLDWLLENYNGFFARLADNLAPQFGSAWQPVWPEQYPEPSFSVSAHGTCAGFQTDGADGPFRALACQIGNVTAGDSYKLSLEYTAEKTWHTRAVFAMITAVNQDGWPITRAYAMHTHPGKLHHLITLPDGTNRVEIALGLKGVGKIEWYQPLFVRCKPPADRKAKVISTYLFPGNVPAAMQENLSRIGRVFDKAGAKKPDLVLFSETINDRGFDLPFAEKCEPIDGPFCTLMRQKARQYHCYCMFTLHERAGTQYHNTAVLLDRNGDIAGIQRKTHLTYMEYAWGMTPGHSYEVFDTDFGKVGMLVCWDAYFPEPAREMVKKGAEVLLVSTAGNPSSRHIARAMENGVYVAVAGAGAQEEGCLPSKIIDPAGRVLAQTIEDEGLAEAVMDLTDRPLIEWLSLGPCLAEPHNVYWNEYRPDLYPEKQP